MIQAVNQLIDALRGELQQQGEMLARLDQQQELIVGAAPDDVLVSVQSIQDQSDAIAHAREVRLDKQCALAAACHLPSDCTVAQLAERVPAAYRPLLQALVDENNECLTRIQRRARQNQVLLRRAVDLMQNLLRSLLAPGQQPGYTDAGSPAERELLIRGALCDLAG